MSWIAITSASVIEEFTERERAAITAEQDAVDNLPTILSRTIGMARGMVSAGGNLIGPAGTCPEQIIPDVIAIARWRLLVAVPKLRPLCTEERKRAHDEGMRRLEAIAAGDVSTEEPEEAITTSTPSGGVDLVRDPGDNPFSGIGTT